MSGKLFGLLVVCALLVGSPLSAAVYTVNSGDVADLNQAIADANANPGPDTIQITAAGSYVGDITWPTEGVTIEATVAGVVIEKNAGTDQVFRCDPNGAGTTGATDTFVFRGAGETAKLTIRNSITASPLINTGPDAASDEHNVIVENVILEQATSIQGGMISFNNINAQQHQLINVDFVGGDTGANGNTNWPLLLGSWTYVSGCDFSGANSGGQRIVYVGTAPLTIENCLIHASASGPAGCFGCNNAAEVTFTDCSFMSNGATAIDWWSTPPLGPAEYTLIRPTFVGNCGAIMFHCAFGSQGILNVIGEPDNKVDFSESMNNGTIVAARFTWGEINLIDCTGDSDAVGNLIDCNWEGALAGPVTINMDGCVWKGNAGCCDLMDQYDPGTPEITAYPIVLNATNTIWLGDGKNTRGYHISTNDDYWDGAAAVSTRSVTNTLNFVHCTMDGDVAVTAFSWPIMTDSHDYTAINGYYSIFDGSTDVEDALGIFSNLAPLNGNGNLCYGNGELPGMGGALAFLAGEPAETISLDPLLDADGYISTFSPAIGKAVGSWLDVDVIGQDRPMPEGSQWADIGAYEEQTISITPPGPSSSVGSWSLYE